MNRFFTSLAVGAAAAAVAAGYPAGAEAQYYKGKTIEFIVGFASGGTDNAARTIARRLQKYIPGAPKVVVKNMPGGASLKAQNFIFERAKPDGFTLGFNPFQVMAEITQRKGVRFSYPEFTYIAGVKASAFVTFARTDIAPGGFKGPQDIKKINKPLTYTGRNPLHSIDVVSTLAFDMLGMKHGYVPGFRGSAAIVTSVEQNETNITGSGAIMWLKHATPRLLNKGLAVPMFQFGIIQPDGSLARDPAFKDIPNFIEYYKQVQGKEPSGPDWEAFQFAQNAMGIANFIVVGPPKMNPEATKILRGAYKKAMADPETIAEAKKAVLFAFKHVGYDRARKVMDDLRNTPPHIAKYWKERTARQAGAGK